MSSVALLRHRGKVANLPLSVANLQSLFVPQTYSAETKETGEMQPCFGTVPFTCEKKKKQAN